MPPAFAYVGCRTTRARNGRGTGIGVYQIEGDAQTWREVEIFGPLDNPSFLVLNARQDVLYCVHGDGSEVSSYRIDAVSGRLTLLNRRSCEGRNPVHLALSRDGATLHVANYATGSLATLEIEADGALGALWRNTPLPGEPGPHRIEQTASHPHQIPRYVTPRDDTDWHIVPDKGLDTVFAVQWAAGSHEARVVGQRTREGSGPRHAAFHPSLSLVYVVNELDSTVVTFRFDIVSGVLEPLHTVSVIPPAYQAMTRAAGIAMHPNGRALYVSNRGHDSIATLTLDDASGLPGQAQWLATGGQCPRFIGLGPEATHLYATNELSDSIVQFALDASSGHPRSTGYALHSPSPVCIVFKTR